MGAVTPGETLGTLYNIHVGSNKTKQHSLSDSDPQRERERDLLGNNVHDGGVQGAAR